MSKILVAEDNLVNRELLCEILETGRYEILEAKDGEEALAKMEESTPDLVLLDINMPVLDGFAVIQKVRQHPKLSKLPVVAVTAYAMKEDKDKVLEAGFDGYVAKPIDAAALLNTLKRFV